MQKEMQKDLKKKRIEERKISRKKWQKDLKKKRIEERKK